MVLSLYFTTSIMRLSKVNYSFSFSTDPAPQYLKSDVSTTSLALFYLIEVGMKSLL